MVGDQFSHYRILSRLGVGGMGEVFLAEDLSLHRRVALKFLLTGSDNGRESRLLHEARAAAHLDHPFICKVYEIGEHDGRAFLAMEYVEGSTLRDSCVGRPLPAPDALRMAREIAEAVHFAHTRGIVHRDLKPSNVMLTTDGHVKVMDFGIAKRLSTPFSGDGATTAQSAEAPGTQTGTLAYMSPEQVRGDPVDARSDVFAFGVLLHELLTGTHPFMRHSSIETAHAILKDPAPSLETLEGVPPLLAHVVDRCLEKDRERRYQSLSDVRIELETTTSRVTAPAAGAGRRRTAIIAAVALAGILATAAAVVWIRPLPFLGSEQALAFNERDWIVVADFNNLTSDPVFDRSLRLALEVAIAQSQYVNVFPPDRVAATLQRMQRPRPQQFDEALATEVALREGVRGVLACDIAQLGSVYSLTARLIDPQTRAAVLTDSMEAANKDDVLNALGRLATRVRSNLGESLASLSESRSLPQVTTSSLDALKMYADALRTEGAERESSELLRQAIALDPSFALAHAELGRRYYLASDRGTRETAETHLAKALELTDRLSLRERLWIQAVAEDSRGHRERAVDAYKTYLTRYPDDGRALFRLAWTQMATLGRFAEAADGFRRLIEIEPKNSSAHVNLASCYSGLRQYDAAIASYDRAFQLDPRMLLAVFVNHEYGFTLAQVGRFEEASRAFTRVKQEGEPVNQGYGYRSQALLEMYQGRYAEAAAQLRQAIARDQTYNLMLSEFRDRLYLITALEARAQSEPALAEWRAVDRLVAKLSLDPLWLSRPVRMKARRGQTADARRFFALMPRTAGKSAVDAGANRNIQRDGAYLNLAEAELALADGQVDRALQLIEPAHLYLENGETLSTYAAALAAAGRPEAAATRYEELLDKPPLGQEGQELWFEAHLALGELYEKLGRAGDARRLYTALLDRWKDGDDDLVLRRGARDRLAKLAQ